MSRRYRRARRRIGSRRDPAPVLLVTDDEYGSVLVAIARLLWRYRSEMAPPSTALVLAAIGAWTHARHPGWAPTLAVLTLVTTVILASPWSGRWASWVAVLGRPAERLYTALVVGLGGLWVSAATAWDPTTPPLPTAALVGTVLGGVPWWMHRRRRARVRVERTITAWPQFAEAVGLPGSRVLSAVVDRWGWTARLALRRGQTARNAIDHASAIESALGVRSGAVRIEPDLHRADRALLRVIETDPHAEPIPWPGIRQPAGQAQSLSIALPIELGVFEDGSPVLLPLLYRNTLIGGVVGSGKSGILNVLLAALAACTDVVIWGIDLKGGMELQPWASCLGRLATTGADAVTLLADAVAELERRAADLSAAGQRLWPPAPDAPALLIVVDEYAELPDTAHTYADSLARRGRATAVNLLAATQRPTQQAMGKGAVRSQMDSRLCLRVRERRDVDLILGQGMYAAGWHPDALDAPGKFLISTPDHITPRPARAYLLDDADVQAAVAQYGGHQPTIAATSTLARAEGEATQQNFSDSDSESAQVGLAFDPDAALWEALARMPDAGASISELMTATQMSRRWVYYRLRTLRAAGRVVRTSRGCWQIINSADCHDS